MFCKKKKFPTEIRPYRRARAQREGGRERERERERWGEGAERGERLGCSYFLPLRGISENQQPDDNRTTGILLYSLHVKVQAHPASQNREASRLVSRRTVPASRSLPTHL